LGINSIKKNMISLDKKYRTRGGKTPEIYSVGNQHVCSVHGSLNGEVVAWTAEGKYNPYKISNSDHDLIEVDEYSEILTEARRRYKVGDNLRCFVDNEVYKLHSFDYPSTTELTLEGKELWLLDPTCTGIKVYANGKWADKVEIEEAQPEVIDLDAMTTDSLINLITRCIDNINNRRA
jgi:hypothetical protein